eukprot:11541557-Heterocapsa_arctica.AAC.1
MRATVPAVLTTFCKTRAWTRYQLSRVQRIANKAVRSCFITRLRDMKRFGISDDKLREVAGWDKMDELVSRYALTWLGHVARMPIHRRPKLLLFGWWDGRRRKPHAPVMQAQFLEGSLKKAGISSVDWYRLAQDRG